MNCSSCSQPLVPGRGFCGSCGTAVAGTPTAQAGFVPAGPARASVGVAPPQVEYQTIVRERPAPDAAPRGSRYAADMEQTLQFKLAHGEVIKGTFDIAGWTRRLGSMKGRLVVTDARLLYKARATNVLNESAIDKEIHLPDVSGLSLVARRGLDPAGVAVLVMLGIGFVLVELLMLASSLSVSAIGVFLVGGFVVFVITALIAWFVYRAAKVERVAFSIQTRAAGGTPIQISGSEAVRWSPLRILALPLLPVFDWLGVDHASMADGDASYELTRKMYDEIGALILDLQSRGVLADAVS